ncbi:MAG: FG-GAP repeat protein, partial [Paenibacillaceae bacterium]|nr:FG-GAP repeat protein [Paenibacillaceae bacterium]
MNTQKQAPTNGKKRFRTIYLQQASLRKCNIVGLAAMLVSMQVLMHVSISLANAGTTVIAVESPTVKMPINGTVSLPSVLNTTVATPWTPAQLANVSAWYDVSDASTVSVDAQGRVSQLRDKSGNNRHLVQAVTTRQPQRVLNAANGKPVVRFDSDDLLTTTPFAGGALIRKMGKGYVGEKLGDLSDLDQHELLGSSVSLNAAGDRMAVGSWNRTPTSPNDSSMPGAVRLYQKNADGSWKLEAKICAGCSGGKNINVTTLEDTDQFGVHGVSLNAKGDLLAVGAPMDDGPNNEYNNTGAVYLFAFSDDAFSNGKLQGVLGKGHVGGKFSSLDSLDNFDQFGTSVALDGLGTKLVVGARYDDGFMNGTTNSGAVYTFGTNGGFSYLLQGIIGAGYVGGKSLAIDQLQPYDQLGTSVSVNSDGGRLAIGAVGDDGYNAYDEGKGRGAVYLVGFSSGSTFGGAELKSIIGQGVSQETTRPRNVPISLDTNDQFGFSVSLNALGTRLAVASPYEDAINDTLTSTGKVRMFSFNPNTEFEGGTLESTIGTNVTGDNNINIALDGSNTNEDVVELPNNPLGDHFGTVALNATGNRIIVGAKGDDGASKITPNSGGVYEFSFPNDITFTASGGDQGEYVAVRAALSLEDQQKLDGYLAHKWGKVASLPDNHPFKLTPPLLGTTNVQQYPVVWTTSTVDTSRSGVYTVFGALTLPQNVNNTLFNRPVFATVQVDTLTLSTTNPIMGIRAPVTGDVPVTTVTPTNEYTGTVTWSPSVP